MNKLTKLIFLGDVIRNAEILDAYKIDVKYDDNSSNKLVTYSLEKCVGIADVYEAPFDKLSKYTITWHVYVNNKGVIKTSFSILKTLSVERNRIEVVSCY